MKTHDYYVYILTNIDRSVLYIGVTNNLSQRVQEHFAASKAVQSSAFTRKYRAVYLVYYEYYGYVNDAIAREKRLKGITRAKKDALISWYNPQWRFLNNGIDELTFDDLIEWTDELVSGRPW